MKNKDLNKFKLPDTPGVYFFLGSPTHKASADRSKKILYIGKATSLKDRVKSYFARDILLTRSPLIAKMLEEADRIKFTQTDSVLEALLLEANEIKKHQPVYNSKEKDDKSYNYVTITTEDFPKVLITRGSGTYGPFPHGVELKEALKIVRRIFPYSNSCTPCEALAKKGRSCKPCFNAQIGLCPGPCAGWITKKDYKKIIRRITLFFEAKKPQLIKSLEKEMKILATEHKFEEAEKVKRQIFALDHIQDIALIKQDLVTSTKSLATSFRIEAYDVAHLSGKDTVGVMTVVEDGELAKSQYRKFKIKLDKNDDTANLKEVLTRRLNHPEWRLPGLIIVDGGTGQINAAREVLKLRDLEVPVVSVIKDERHKPSGVMGEIGKKENGQSSALTKSILLANSEAHRFAIGYHRKLRGKGFRI